jgi:hypothetical protein
VDVEKTIEFILEQQARLDSMLIERDAIGRRTDARLDRAVRLGTQELRRERVRRQALKEQFEEQRRISEEQRRISEEQRRASEERSRALDQKLDRLAATVQRYLDSLKNGHNGHS